MRKGLLYIVFCLLGCVTARAGEADSVVVQYHRNTVALLDTATWEGRLQRQLDSLCNTPLFETTQLGFYVYDVTAKEELFAVNHLWRMRPASCQKIVTAVTALKVLGGDYKLHTNLCMTGEVQDSVLVGDVCVAGGMDPVLAQGDVMQMARALHEQGIDSIAGRICLDLTMKDDKPLGWGWCWDDDWGPLSALMVDGKDCFGEELLADLRYLGIGVQNDTLLYCPVPATSRTLHTVTHTIDQVLDRMMKQSDNIYAESLFHHIAACGGKRGVGRKMATTHINQLIKSLGLSPEDHQIADGSGLSLYNYVTPHLLVCLLAYAWDTPAIRQHLYPSLPIAGEDGTLKKRFRKTVAEGNVRAKTGTVDGISSLAGYATAPNGHLLAFAIINQGVPKSSVGKDFQDKVCVALCQDRENTSEQ